MVESPLTTQLGAAVRVHHRSAVIVYRTLLVIDLVIAALFTLFVVIILGEYSSSTRPDRSQALLEDVLWTSALLAGAWVPLIVGMVLKARGRLEEAKLVLFIPVL